MLNFEKYKESHLLENDKEITVRALYSQHFTFFKDISNLSINNTIKFNIKIDISNFHTDYIFIKYFESDNFENLFNNFPSNREDFDSQIGHLNMGGNFDYTLIKQYKSQRGVLIGIYVDDPGFYWKIYPTYIHVNMDDNNDDDNDDKESDSPENEESSSTDMILGIIITIIIIIIIVRCYCYVKSKEKYYDSDKCFIIIFIESY